MEFPDAIESTDADFQDSQGNILSIGLSEEGEIFYVLMGVFFPERKMAKDIQEHLKALNKIKRDFCFPLHPEALKQILTKQERYWP